MPHSFLSSRPERPDFFFAPQFGASGSEVEGPRQAIILYKKVPLLPF